MRLYHGSYTEIKSPDLLHSRKNVDFGLGFYTTPLYEQSNLQICFRTQKALDYSLLYEGSETI
ncbi:MAG: DUF3990 domain-containing protein [Lachnoanaerobaculum sp.]|nr:DUF3990 domain-containing protein [Lachnoanaerobaculum sp.]